MRPSQLSPVKICKTCGIEKNKDEFDRMGKEGSARRKYIQPSCKECVRVYQRMLLATGRKRWKTYDTAYHLRRTLRVRYNLSWERYEEILQKQGGKCAICRRDPSPTKRLSVDHDHGCCSEVRKSCGKCVRGLLCNQCNWAVGAFEDSIDRMYAAAEYIKSTMEIINQFTPRRQ